MCSRRVHFDRESRTAQNCGRPDNPERAAQEPLPRVAEHRRIFELFDMDMDGAVSLEEGGAMLRVLARRLQVAPCWLPPLVLFAALGVVIFLD